MGVCGLWCFIVGYARVRKDLCHGVSLGAMIHILNVALIPDGVRMLACLTVEKAQLLEAFGEGVFGRHASHYEDAWGRDGRAVKSLHVAASLHGPRSRRDQGTC